MKRKYTLQLRIKFLTWFFIIGLTVSGATAIPLPNELSLLVHLARLREFTSGLNGTVGSTAVDVKLGTFLGAFYILLYLVFVILLPVLVLASTMLTVWQRCVRKEEGCPIIHDL
jgi:hypothetical protein